MNSASVHTVKYLQYGQVDLKPKAVPSCTKRRQLKPIRSILIGINTLIFSVLINELSLTGSRIQGGGGVKFVSEVTVNSNEEKS
jgi:hypothetical protein